MSQASDFPNQFAGQYAVVTGGTQGLGEAVARLFARRGAAGIVICGRNAQRGEAVARDLTKSGCDTRFVQADLAAMEDCRKVVAAADKAWGKLHMLVNCAGMTDRGTILDTSPELFDRMFAVNVRAPFFLMQAAVEVMKRHKIHGSIVHIGSVASHGGAPFLVPYSTSKGALNVLTRAVANNLKRDRIRVNTLNIGWTNTPREHVVQTVTHHRPQNWLEQVSANQPFGRLIQPEEVARAVAFLASDESGLMTGSLVDFDQTILGTTENNPGV